VDCRFSGKEESQRNRLSKKEHIITEIKTVVYTAKTHATDGYSLQARLNVSLPGVDHEVAESLVRAAHQTCPYSKATRGNISVEINLL